MRSLWLIALLLGSCGDDDGGGSGTGGADAPISGGADGAGTPDGPDGPPGGNDGPPSGLPDAAPSACSGLDQETCGDTAGCEPGCYSLCDCTCPGLGPYDPCDGCEACAKACMVWGTCLSEATLTACGDGFCESATEICVRRAAFGVTFRCEPVPDGCEGDRTCGCAGDDLCIEGFNVCVDTDAPNTIECVCPACA